MSSPSRKGIRQSAPCPHRRRCCTAMRPRVRAATGRWPRPPPPPRGPRLQRPWPPERRPTRWPAPASLQQPHRACSCSIESSFVLTPGTRANRAGCADTLACSTEFAAGALTLLAPGPLQHCWRGMHKATGRPPVNRSRRMRTSRRSCASVSCPRMANRSSSANSLAYSGWVRSGQTLAVWRLFIAGADKVAGLGEKLSRVHEPLPRQPWHHLARWSVVESGAGSGPEGIVGGRAVRCRADLPCRGCPGSGLPQAPGRHGLPHAAHAPAPGTVPA